VFFLALKLLKKLVMGTVWLVKLPIRITMKLAGLANSDEESRSATPSRANTNAGTTAGATGKRPDTETQSATSAATTDRQQATAPAGGAAAATASAGSLSKYRRFRQSLLAFAGLYALTVLWLLVDTNLLAYGFGGQFVIGGLTNGVVPVGLWYWTRTRSKVAWGVTMGYAAIMLLLSLATTTAFTVAVPNSSVFDVQPILALLQLASLAVLGAALFFGATGRTAVGQPGAVAPEPTESGGGTRESTGADTTASSASPAAAEQSPQASSSRTAAGEASRDRPGDDPTPSAASTAADTPSTATAAPATENGPAENSDPSPSDQAESGGATTDATTTTGEATVASDDEGTGDDETAADGVSGEIDPLLDSLRAEPPDPETVRELGEAVPSDSPPEAVVETLAACSRADDPAVRVAVCEVCADLEDPEAESVLERLRIDTNDRVATTAMNAL
jgi:hypothetical protein